jgi:hypothetical protein
MTRARHREANARHVWQAQWAEIRKVQILPPSVAEHGVVRRVTQRAITAVAKQKVNNGPAGFSDLAISHKDDAGKRPLQLLAADGSFH